MSDLARIIEALLFLSPDPVAIQDLGEVTGYDEDEIVAAIAELDQRYAPGEHGLQLKRVAGGITLATDAIAETAARRLLAKPRTPPLTPAQAETLAIVAYLQPVSRPEITRIRGVSADSATATLIERGLIEESGRSQFGAILYRTTPLFLQLFGLDVAQGAARRQRLGPHARGTGRPCATGCCAPARCAPADRPRAARQRVCWRRSTAAAKPVSLRGAAAPVRGF